MDYAAFGEQKKQADERAFRAWAAQRACYGEATDDMEAFGRFYAACDEAAREREAAFGGFEVWRREREAQIQGANDLKRRGANEMVF